jgi:hypothetical protein
MRKSISRTAEACLKPPKACVDTSPSAIREDSIKKKSSPTERLHQALGYRTPEQVFFA